MNTVSPYSQDDYKRAVEGTPEVPVVQPPVVEEPKKRGRGRPKGSKNIRKSVVCPKCGTVLE